MLSSYGCACTKHSSLQPIHTFSTIPNRLTSTTSSTGWHSFVPYIPSILGYKITSLVGCDSRDVTQCSRELRTEKPHIFELCFGATGVTHGVQWRSKPTTVHTDTQPFCSRWDQAWAVWTWVSLYHIVCRSKTNAKQMILLVQIPPLTQFHSSHMFSQYMAQQHYAAERYTAKYLSANTASGSRNFPSSGCQKRKIQRVSITKHLPLTTKKDKR